MRVTFLSIPFAFAAAALTFAISAAPALAGSPTPATPAEVCAAAPAALRTLAESATPNAQRLALRDVNTGIALCEARNRSEAVKKFNAAAKVLGTDLATAMAGGTVTASID